MNNQDLLNHALYASWDKDTTFPWSQDEWSNWNRSLWQCAVTALVVNDILWWEIRKWFVDEIQNTHYWNCVDWLKYDFTDSQFKWNEITVSWEESVTREKLLSNKNTSERYAILAKRVNERINGILWIEDSINKCQKCENVSHFEHNSIHLWKNTSLLFIWEAPAKNWWRLTWKAWRNEKWNIIPTWKILGRLLETINLELLDVTFLEAVKCLPSDRKSLKMCSENCSDKLEGQISNLRPNVLIPLWEHASRILLKWTCDFKKFWEVVWKEFEVEIEWYKYIIYPIYHPSPASPLAYKWNLPIFKKLKEKYGDIINN